MPHRFRIPTDVTILRSVLKAVVQQAISMIRLNARDGGITCTYPVSSNSQVLPLLPHPVDKIFTMSISPNR